MPTFSTPAVWNSGSSLATVVRRAVRVGPANKKCSQSSRAQTTKCPMCRRPALARRQDKVQGNGLRNGFVSEPFVICNLSLQALSLTSCHDVMMKKNAKIAGNARAAPRFRSCKLRAPQGTGTWGLFSMRKMAKSLVPSSCDFGIATEVCSKSGRLPGEVVRPPGEGSW